MTTLERSFEDAPALPFVPYVPNLLDGNPDALRAMLAVPPMRRNRRRRRPPLAMAVLCLLSCTSSLIATSSPVEAEMAAMVPQIRITMDNARDAVLGSESERAQMSFNEAGFR
jgi:hypothetical protein